MCALFIGIVSGATLLRIPWAAGKDVASSKGVDSSTLLLTALIIALSMVQQSWLSLWTTAFEIAEEQHAAAFLAH